MRRIVIVCNPRSSRYARVRREVLDFLMNPNFLREKYGITGVTIFRYEVDTLADFTIENIKNESGVVVENKKNPGVWGVKNLSDMTWYRHSPGGKEEIRKKDEVVPVIRQNSIKFGTFSEGTIK